MGELLVSNMREIYEGNKSLDVRINGVEESMEEGIDVRDESLERQINREYEHKSKTSLSLGRRLKTYLT